MFRYVPPGLPPGAPLVVLLHGCTQTGAGFAYGSGWSTLAARHNFALLVPEQVRSNNVNCCFNWFEPGDITRDLGEAASISAMVAQMAKDVHHDPSRVFVTGLSAGGAMTAAMLATYPDVFAAGAIIAGLPYGAARNVSEALGAMRHCPTRTSEDWASIIRHASPAPQRRPIISIWHGDADQTVNVDNAIQSARQWCAVHSLADQDGTDLPLAGARRRVWRDDRGTARVECNIVPGHGHGVPINTRSGDERAVGHAMPYVIDSDIASTWHIARGWGLV